MQKISKVLSKRFSRLNLKSQSSHQERMGFKYSQFGNSSNILSPFNRVSFQENPSRKSNLKLARKLKKLKKRNLKLKAKLKKIKEVQFKAEPLLVEKIQHPVVLLESASLNIEKPLLQEKQELLPQGGASLHVQSFFGQTENAKALKESIEAFLLDQRSEHTRTAYGKDLKRFVKFLLERNFSDAIRSKGEAINRALLIQYKEFLISENLQHTTIDRHLATLRSFFGWLVDDGVIEKNPMDGVRFLNPGKLSSTNAFTDDEVQKVLKVPNLHTRVGALHYAILMVLFYTGMRRSEISGLTTQNISEERGHKIVKLKGKGNKERIIPLIPPVWNAIVYYLRITRRELQEKLWLKAQPLFLPVRNNRTGVKQKPIDPSMIYYIVKNYSKKAGIEKVVSPHSCRATAISNARDQNVPDRAIQEFAGWSTLEMLTRYDKRKTAIENSAALSIEYGDSVERDLPEWPELLPSAGE